MMYLGSANGEWLVLELEGGDGCKRVVYICDKCAFAVSALPLSQSFSAKLASSPGGEPCEQGWARQQFLRIVWIQIEKTPQKPKSLPTAHPDIGMRLLASACIYLCSPRASRFVLLMPYAQHSKIYIPRYARECRRRVHAGCTDDTYRTKTKGIAV
ncbi:hypothetical protein K440DRAFT_296084 [Wilcoxina mikolae CBS 423.85]|nr:hypothetical protein K440DRAFT_296084 [Wilcoxina mikolae CBS 423.85]